MSIEFKTATLENGLDVVAECNPDAASVALGFFVETGARDETEDLSGVSHFLEHMVFKGTPTRSPDDVNREFDEMGAQYNAYTSDEHTVYYAYVLPEHVERTVALWADVLRPSLREADFDGEKKVILEEIRMYADQPPYGADDRCKALYFRTHPLAKPVLGTEDSVGALTALQMREYFRERYSPGNIVLVAVGNVDFGQLVEHAQTYCGAWEPFKVAQRTMNDPGSHADFETVVQANSVQEYVLQLAAGPGASDPLRYAAKLLSMILGDDSGSRLFWEFIDTGLADHASLSHYEYADCGLFYSYLSCSPEQTADNLQRLLDLYREVEASGVTEQELELAKAKVNSQLVLRSERPRGRLFTVGGNWTQRREYRSVKDDMQAVAALTSDDLAAVLKRFPLSTSTTTAVGPQKQIATPK